MKFDMGVVTIVALVAVGVLVLAWLVFRNPPKSADELASQIFEATAVAKDFVAAAEQLYVTGKLPANQRFQWVEEQLAGIYDFDPEQLRALIESGVYWLKQTQRTQQPIEAQGLPRNDR